MHKINSCVCLCVISGYFLSRTHENPKCHNRFIRAVVVVFCIVVVVVPSDIADIYSTIIHATTSEQDFYLITSGKYPAR